MTAPIAGRIGFIGAYAARALPRTGERIVTLDPPPGNVIARILGPAELARVHPASRTPPPARKMRDAAQASSGRADEGAYRVAARGGPR